MALIARLTWVAPAILLHLSSLPVHGQVFVNQSGYDLWSPKRFTASRAPEGSLFDIVRSPASSAPGLFQGRIQGGVGDFTAFNPQDTGGFRVLLEDGTTSVPFAIGPNWVAKSSAWLALDFMLDARCEVGCHASCMAGTLFRDAHQFSFEIPSLVKLYLANPALWSRVREGSSTGSLPEIVGLIEWAAGRIVSKGRGHTLFKAQLAYYLFAFPSLQPNASLAPYEKVRDYTFAKWRNNVRN